MNPILKNILAVIAGWIGGSIVNMSLVQLGNKVFPLEGVDTNNMEALAAAMPNLSAENFIFPFLAHALGTLVGAIIAFKMAAHSKFKMAMIVGVIFLLGGIAVNYILTGPIWFTALDVLVAYIPMAWLGARLVREG